jgi:orotate phosphoribosyltransferase
MNRSINSIEERSKELAPLLWESNCLDFGEFTLTSGKKSPYYVDLRLLPSHPEKFARAIEKAADFLEAEPVDFDAICAVPTGGLPFGTALAQRMEKPLTYVRKEGKSHGEGRKIEGEISQGDRVLLVDDIITTGGSVISAGQSVREAGAQVDQVAVLVDRTEGAAKNLEEEDFDLLKLANIGPVVEELKRSGKISNETFERVQDYLSRR